jgi:hypothetical protein
VLGADLPTAIRPPDLGSRYLGPSQTRCDVLSTLGLALSSYCQVNTRPSGSLDESDSLAELSVVGHLRCWSSVVDRARVRRSLEELV